MYLSSNSLTNEPNTIFYPKKRAMSITNSGLKKKLNNLVKFMLAQLNKTIIYLVKKINKTVVYPKPTHVLHQWVEYIIYIYRS